MVDFLIDHLDPLGQGVSKRINLQKKPIITFIPKTLPGEQGSAQVIKSSKGVEFAELSSLTKASQQRIEPECPHYAKCSGCDYQHISYEDELSYKQSALLFLLRRIDINGKQVEVIPAPQRFAYRNRVQLHYRHKYLGLVDANADRVLEVPECRLMSPSIKKKVDELYADKAWMKEHEGRGHVEIYEKSGDVSVRWNQPYADGGFSQVNSEMNSQLKNWLYKRFSVENYSSILDIFSGDGNLSDVLMISKNVRRIMVDSCQTCIDLDGNSLFIKQDLFLEGSFEKFLHRSKLKKVDILLLDPPRKGFSNISEWEKRLTPEYIAYVSCNPATLARDLQDLMKNNKKLKVQNVLLLDMFPSTKHFETLVVLRN